MFAAFDSFLHQAFLSFSRPRPLSLYTPVCTSILLFLRRTPNVDDLFHGWDLELTHIPCGLVAHLAYASSPSLGRDTLLVCGEIEGDEE